MAIFVFGSNLAGKHYGGAARHAHTHYGAEMGVGEGPTGHCYAIPTLTADFAPRSLEAIRSSVATFLKCAASHPNDVFYVTRIGCGIAGFTDEQIAPMFAGAPSNCTFDPLWSGYGYPQFKEAM